MAAPTQTLALPWFTRSDYPALLELFSDFNKLPTTYDAWLERAERIEREFQKAGFGVSKTWISTHSLCDLVRRAEHFS